LPRVERASDGTVVLAEAPAGSLAYVDADWLVSTGSLPCIIVSPGGRLTWADRPAPNMPSQADPDEAAVVELFALAEDIVEALRGVPADAVDVTGRGLIARRVRDRLFVSEPARSRPLAVVETTGDPARILEATRHVADLGTVVLAGETAGRVLDLNLYQDVHLRGITLLGIPPPFHAGRGSSELRASTPSEIARARGTCADVRSGFPPPSGALWYRIVS
jgi:hypothetical protein